ncbi:hypothetical protein D3C78_1409240 [compost metagenome]
MPDHVSTARCTSSSSHQRFQSDSTLTSGVSAPKVARNSPSTKRSPSAKHCAIRAQGRPVQALYQGISMGCSARPFFLISRACFSTVAQSCG